MTNGTIKGLERISAWIEEVACGVIGCSGSISRVSRLTNGTIKGLERISAWIEEVACGITGVMDVAPPVGLVGTWYFVKGQEEPG